MENESLISLAFSVNGGTGRKTIIFYGRIAENLTEKRKESCSVTMAWLRKKYSFSVMRSIIKGDR